MYRGFFLRSKIEARKQALKNEKLVRLSEGGMLPNGERRVYIHRNMIFSDMGFGS